VRDPSGTDSRKARGAKTPGGADVSEETSQAHRGKDSEGREDGRLRPTAFQARGRNRRKAMPRPVTTPGGEKKLKGGSGHTGRVSGEESTDFRGE
jgi:hypothetical protein